MIDEKDLIQKCIQGNLIAQKSLYHLYSKKFYAICLRYAKHEEVAQDILQDSFIKIFTKINTFKGEGSFEGWMKRIVIHTSIEYYRRKESWQEYDALSSDVSFADTYELDVDMETILKWIQELPDGYRVVFNMYVIEGYSHSEIAQELGISEGTSKSQLFKAKALMKSKIDKYYS